MVPVPVCNLWVAIAGFFNALVPASVREKPVDFIKREYGYFFKHEKKVTKLNEQMGKLKAAKLRVENNVEHAMRNREMVYEEVHKWLEASNAKLNPENTEEFHNAVENVKVQRFLGLCPDLWSRRQLSKKAEKEGKDMGKLLKEYTDANNFERVGNRRALQGIRPELVQEFDAFESRHSIFEGIMEALKDPSVNRIGVHGMPGVGKTMLVRKIGHQARENCLFDEVVITGITNKPKIRKIQGDIADGLGLKLSSENESGRATEISDRLNNGQRVLIILDDIWGELKLEEIGISSQGDQTIRGRTMLLSNTVSNCKLLMASRSQGVLRVMKSDKNFEVSILTSEESKVLFTKIAGNVATQPNYKLLADAIISKCVGLPLAIEAVAKALLNTGNTSLYAWKDLLQKLESSEPRKINEMDESVYTALKLSYEMLKDKEAQQLFLFCGMQPQGSDISILSLLWYSVGLGLFSDAHTIDEARTRVKALLHKLKSSSLLLKGGTDEEVKMHDLFREVAIIIAEGDKMLVIKDEIDFKSPSAKQKLVDSTHISFPSRIHELPDTIAKCSKLEFLMLINDYPSLKVPDNFFQQMADLKVLYLELLEKLSALPKSLTSLVNLQTLCSFCCSGMQDISSIGELSKLCILSLCSSDIEELPEDLRQLIHLRVLNLTDCRNLRVIPANIISSMTRLEELYMGNSFSRWDVEENASLHELKDLLHLKILQFHIFPIQIIPQDLYFENLIAYRIFIGDGWKWKWFGKYDNLRQLKVNLDTGTDLTYNIKQLLQNTEDLRLDKLGVRDLLDELDRHGFLQLKNLKIKNNSCIQYLINFEEVLSCSKAFPSLESLILNGLSNLEKICHGQPTVEAFVRLKTVKVEDCGKLKNLFTCSMVKYLPQLEEIEVNDCDNLVEILGGEMVDGFDATESIGYDLELLKNVRSLTLRRLPKFVSLLPQGLMQLLFNGKVLLPQLEKLQLSMLNVKQIWQDRMPSEVSSSLGNLTNLIIENCNHLVHLFSFSIPRCLERLKRLQVSGCENMIVIVVGEEREATNELDYKISFPQLNFLKLKGLKNLTGFCSGNHDLEFPCLKELEITMCSNFEGFSPMSYTGLKPLFDKKVTLPNVETITISHIKSERLLLDDELVENAFSKLKELKVKFCENLDILFAANLVHKFKALERLYVENCNALEAIYEIQRRRVTSPITEAQLKVLWCWHLPKLKHVWSIDPHGVATFHEIDDVIVWNCEELGHLMPASVARGLPQLDRLTVCTCEKMEEIVASTVERGDRERSIMFEFPRASVLQLWDLPNLKSFYRGTHTTNWPMLRKVQARHCGQLKIFSFTQEMHQTDAPHSTSVWQQPLFSCQQVISGLEELLVEDVNIIKCISEGRLRNVHMDTVKALIVCESDHSHANEVADLLPEFLNKFPNLQDLQLTDCIGVRLVPRVAVPRLKRLALYQLPNLEQSWSQYCDSLLNGLETLDVIECSNLITLSHSWASFQSLTTLYMGQCHQVAHVFSASTASTLVQLKKMTIRGCRMLTHVISREEEGETSRRSDRSVTFKMLRILRLKSLPSLTCFSATTATLSHSFPSLETLTVKRCPKLRIFCQGRLHTPVLKGMRLVDTDIDEADDRPYWFGDINTTVQKIRCLHSRAYQVNEVPTNIEGELAQLMEQLTQFQMDFLDLDIRNLIKEISEEILE